MDPNANLSEQREIRWRILASMNAGTAPNEEDVFRLEELSTALDHWLTSGGFLPEDWAR